MTAKRDVTNAPRRGERGGTGVRDLTRIVTGHRRSLVLAMTLTLVGSALGLAQPLFIRRVIDAAGTGRIDSRAVALLVVVFVAQALVQAVVRYVTIRTAEGVVLRVRRNLVDHVLRLQMPAYDRHRTGDLVSRASTDTVTLRRVISEGFTDAVTGSVVMLGTVGFMMWLDWALFLVVAGIVAVGGVIAWPVLHAIRTASLAHQRRLGEMSSELERALGSIRTVRASRREARETDRIGAGADSAYAASMRMAKLDAVVEVGSEIAVTGSFVVVLLVGGVRVAAGHSSVGELVAFLLYMTYLAVPIGAAFQALAALQQGRAALDRIEEVLTLPVEADEDLSLTAVTSAHPTPPEPPQRDVQPPLFEFRDVWFGYRPDRPLLCGVSFGVPDRGRVALVGPSGAGKSTLFALAERFYDPDAGQVLFHGEDVRALARAELRRHIGLVEQHAPLLFGTLRDNLTYAAPDADEEEVRRAVDLADLSQVVSRLPDGLDTCVGERGMALSGGERQRVAIARSLLARPSLLLLDEPTAHVDALSEEALRRAIERVSNECALLVIAHRFSTVRAAEHVVVLDGGRIVAAGRHDTLLERNEYYRRLAAGSWIALEPISSSPASGEVESNLLVPEAGWTIDG